MDENKYLAFDLETSKLFDGDFSRWREHRPLGIICAATKMTREEPRVWFSRTSGGEYGAKMTGEDLWSLIDYLENAVASGCQIVTWNGLAFDFDILSEESGEWERCKKLAVNHIDMMFDLFCRIGYPIGLEKAAAGFGLGGKYGGMHADQAPLLWKQGRNEEVLNYVAQDVNLTLDVALAADKAHKVSWTSMRGRPQEVPLPEGWLRVSAAARLPQPDVSWMSKPIPRQDFYRWMKKD